VPRDLAQVAPEHFIRAPEEIRGLDKFRGEILPHPDGLRALASEEKCDSAFHLPDKPHENRAHANREFTSIGPRSRH
jgi:hypothetical protein